MFLRTLGLSLLVLGLSGCPFLFSFDRAGDLESGDIHGIAVDEDGVTPLPFARISYADGQRRERAALDGQFTLRGLNEGVWVLRLTKDDEAPFGEPERIAIRQAVIRTVPHGLFGAEQKEFIDLGAIRLEDPGSVRGVVVDEEGQAVLDAKVIAFRRLLSTTDAFGTTTAFEVSQTTIEAQASTDAAGGFELRGIGATIDGESEVSIYAFTGEGDTYLVSDAVSVRVVPDQVTTLEDDLVLRPPEVWDGELKIRFDPPQPNTQMEVTLLTTGTPPGRATGEGCSPTTLTSDGEGVADLTGQPKLSLNNANNSCTESPLYIGNNIDIHVRVLSGNPNNPPLRGALFGVVVGQSVGPVNLSPVALTDSPCFPSPGGTNDDVNLDCDADSLNRFPPPALTNTTYRSVVQHCSGVCETLREDGQLADDVFICDLGADDVPAGIRDLLSDTEPDDANVPWETQYDCDDDDDGLVDFTETYCAGLPAFEVDELCYAPELDAGMPMPDAGMQDAGTEDAGTVDAGPRPIPTLPDVPVGAAIKMSTGGAASCALGADGQAWCWGQHAALGRGEPDGSRRFALPVPLNGDVIDLDVGPGHVCALTDDPTSPVSCWGSNTGTQIGVALDANAPTVTEPATLTGGLLSAPAGAVAIAAGGQHSCAILGDDDDRQVVCWGTNTSGQLGSTATGPVEASVAVGLDEPAAAQGVWSDIEAGAAFTLALTSDGRVFCWGNNSSDQCGQGAAGGNQLSTPTEVSIDAEGPWVEIAAGAAHACARNLYGDVACWGDNSSDQLGRGGDTSVPGLTPTLAAALSAGAQHTCILTDGGLELRCWGDNTDGQLGDGSSGNTSATAVVASLGDHAAYAVAPGGSHTCALTVDETDGDHAPCWGDNGSDQLGRADTDTPAASGLPRKTHVWLGTTNGTWAEAANWSTGLVPGPTDAARLGGAADNTAGTLPQTLTVGTLIIDASYGGTFTRGAGSSTTVNGSFIDGRGALQMSDDPDPSTFTVAPVTGGVLELTAGVLVTSLVSDGASRVKLDGTVGALDLTTPRPEGLTSSFTTLTIPDNGLGALTLRGTAGYADVVEFTEETFNTADVILAGESVAMQTAVGGTTTGWIIDGDFTFADGASGWSVANGVDVTVRNGAVILGDLTLSGALNLSDAASVTVVGLFEVSTMGFVSFGGVSVDVQPTGTMHLLPEGVVYGAPMLLHSGATLGLGADVWVGDVTVDAPTTAATIVSVGMHPLTLPGVISGLTINPGSGLDLEGQLQVNVLGGLTIDNGRVLTVNSHPFSFVQLLGPLTVGENGTVNVDGTFIVESVTVMGTPGAPAVLRARSGGRFESSGSVTYDADGQIISDPGGVLALSSTSGSAGGIINNGDIEVGTDWDTDSSSMITGSGSFVLTSNAVTLNFDGAVLSPNLRIPEGSDYFFNNIDVNLAPGSFPSLIIDEGARLVIDGFGDGFVQLAGVTVHGALELRGATFQIGDGLGGGRMDVGPLGGSAGLDGTLLMTADAYVTLDGSGTLEGRATLDSRNGYSTLLVLGTGMTVAPGGELTSLGGDLTIGSSGQLPGDGDALLHVQSGGRVAVYGQDNGQFSQGDVNVFGTLRVEGDFSMPGSSQLYASSAACLVEGGRFEVGFRAICRTLEQSAGAFLAPRELLRIREELKITGGTFDHRRGEILVEVLAGGSTLDLPAGPQLYALTVEDIDVSSVVITNGSRLNVEGPLKLLGTSGGSTPFDTADGTGFWELNATGPRLVHEADIRRSHNVSGTNMRVDPITVTVDAESSANGWGASCGNGILELPEQCDDGNLLNTDFCRTTCTLNTNFTGGDNCRWIGADDAGSWSDGFNWSGSVQCGESEPGAPDIAIFDNSATGDAYVNGNYTVDTLIIRANTGGRVIFDPFSTLTVNHLVIESCADGCPIGIPLQLGSGSRLVVNQTASIGDLLNINTGTLSLRGHSDLASNVFSASTGAVELVASDATTTWDGRVTVHGHGPTLQGRLDIMSEGDGPADLLLDGVFDRFSTINVSSDGEVTDLEQPITVRSATGALLRTDTLSLRVYAPPDVSVSFDEGITFEATGSLNCAIDPVTIPVTIGGRLRMGGSNYYYNSFPHIGELILDEWSDIYFVDMVFFAGATVGDVRVSPASYLGSYNAGGFTTDDDHQIDGDLVLFGMLNPQNAGLAVNGDVEVLGGDLNLANRLSAHSAHYRYGDVRSPETVILRDAMVVEEGASFDHACSTLTQDATSTGLSLDVDGQPLWQVNLTQGVPVTFAADSETTILHGMSFNAVGGSFVSSEPGTRYRLDARGDLQVAVASYTDADGTGPGYVATSGAENNSVRIVAPATCGDGNLDVGEACDDGGNVGGDGCSAVCTAEPFYTCDGTGCTQVTDVCGDGIVGPTEECDVGGRCEQGFIDCTSDADCAPFGGGACVPRFDPVCDSCLLNTQSPGAACFGCPSLCYDPSPAG
jgi:cysteine-rich repeat protein